MHHLYVSEILGIQEQDPDFYASLPNIIDQVIRGDNEFQLGRWQAAKSEQKQYLCEFCNELAFIQHKWLLSSPNVYTLSFQWLENVDAGGDPHGAFQNDAKKQDISRIMELIPPKLNLGDFYQIKQQNQPTKQTAKGQINSSSKQTPQGKQNDDMKFRYIFRGMVVFYGRHYMAYFYSERFDAWYQYDDSKITRVGNWTDVKNKCIKGLTQPILMFYEKQEVIVDFLT